MQMREIASQKKLAMTGEDQRDRVAKEARDDGYTAGILRFKAIQAIFGLTLILTYLSQTPQPKN